LSTGLDDVIELSIIECVLILDEESIEFMSNVVSYCWSNYFKNAICFSLPILSDFEIFLVITTSPEKDFVT
jgi:hypothetical protein